MADIETIMPNTEPRMVRTNPKRGWRRLKNKKILVVAVILLIAGLVYAYWSHKNAAQSLPPGLSSTQKSQYWADKGNYKAAEQALQDELTTTKDPTAKIGIYYQQSALAVKFKHYDDAKKYADEVSKLSPNSSTQYVSLARLAQAQGNKTLAKQYWQQAIDHLDPNAPGYNLIKRDYQISLDELK